MGIVAIVSIANLPAANAALQSAGWGSVRFSVPAFGNGNPTHAILHTWGPVALENVIKALPNVTFDQSAGTPQTRAAALISAASAQWGDQAPDLPSSGNALANTLYRFGEELWWCVQTFSRTTFNAHPSTYPALIRRSRRPGEVLPWIQPLDQFDAYYVVNPFTGLPDEVTHLGQTWRCTQQSAAGGINTFAPGTFGWTAI